MDSLVTDSARKPVEILCTLGPASMNDRVIARLEELGATLFRINLSHTRLAELGRTIDFIRVRTRVPICIDTEGAQIRSGELADGAVELREHSVVRAHARRVPGDAANLSFYPPGIVRALEPGDTISIDFNAVLAQVIGIEDGGAVAVMRVLNGGRIGANKAVTVYRPIVMPPLTDKDREAIRVGRGMGIRHFALSFASRAADVDELRAAAGPGATVISKIECRNGLTNLDEIGCASDALLIDRGDLGREFPMEQIPELQKRIIATAKRLGTKVYVATNLLESMVASPTPTRAEVNDVYNTLADGANGLVLAAETAIGQYPIRCATMVVRLIHEYRNPRPVDGSAWREDPVSSLVAPHGGVLVHRELAAKDRAALARLPFLAVRDTELMDCEQFALGTYSPLEGFMDRATLESVLEHNRLPDGTTWTMPIVLQADAATAAALAPGACVALGAGNAEPVAVLDVTEVYQADLSGIVKRWFGTGSRDHPGVDRLMRGGDRFVAGPVTLVRRAVSSLRQYELTPAQTRFIFAHKGWSKVVGFHTRNAIHRVHEHIQLVALDESGADGLFVSPVIGPKKKDDFLPEPIMRSYQLMLEFGFYPKGRVVLGSFATYSRYCGPREAVFTALCRKNMGCSHFIVGRDHTGVGDFYAPDANRRLFGELEGLGIAPVFFEDIGYDATTDAYRPVAGDSVPKSISGTEARAALRAGCRLPEWFMRDVVQDMLLGEIAAGRPVFCD